MNDDKRKIKFGFISIPKNTILKHENFLTGKVTALSPGLKFVFGYIKSQDMSIKDKKINDVTIYDINNNKLSFDVTILYRIAGGTHYRDFECKDYYKFLETCVMEEKSKEKEDWLCEFNNKITYHGISFFNRNFKKIYKKGLKKWWKENHPALQYDKFEESVVEDSKFLNSDLKSSLTESFFDEDIYRLDNTSSNSIFYKRIYYSLKKKMAIKGLELVDLNIENIRVRKSCQSQEIADTKEDKLFDIQIKKEDKKDDEKKCNDDNQFVIDYAPLDDGDSPKKAEFNLDYVPLNDNNILWDQYSIYIKNNDYFISDAQEKYIIENLEQIDILTIEENMSLENINKEQLEINNEEINLGEIKTQDDESVEIDNGVIKVLDDSQYSVDNNEDNGSEDTFKETFEDYLDSLDDDFFTDKEDDESNVKEECLDSLMLENQVIQIKRNINNNFTLNIPSFVNNDYYRENEKSNDKVKVLTK